MITIQPVGPDHIQAARTLFRGYAQFLRSIVACHGFDFDHFNLEIDALPHPYTTHKGQVLLAFSHPLGRHPSSGVAAGSIAYRAHVPLSAESAPSSLLTCELKRLFVPPEHRGQDIGRLLIAAALDGARARGYRRAVLDTEPSTMLAAHHLYRELGFTPYVPTASPKIPGILFLEKILANVALSPRPRPPEIV